MDKKKFFVTVQSGEILENEAQSYEFEIEATRDEVTDLQYLFEKAHESENETFTEAVTPYVGYHDDPANHAYDHALKEIYRTLHQLGTPRTKKHIETMGILD